MATVGEVRMRLFTNYFFGNQNIGKHSIGGRGGGGGEVVERTFIDQLESDSGHSVF